MGQKAPLPSQPWPSIFPGTWGQRCLKQGFLNLTAAGWWSPRQVADSASSWALAQADTWMSLHSLGERLSRWDGAWHRQG